MLYRELSPERICGSRDCNLEEEYSIVYSNSEFAFDIIFAEGNIDVIRSLLLRSCNNARKDTYVCGTLASLEVFPYFSLQLINVG